MKTALAVLLMAGVCGGDAVVWKAPYTREVGVNPYLSGEALLNGSDVVKARLTWHGPNYHLLGDTGTWDGTTVSVSGMGCDTDPFPGQCHPSVPMTYSSDEGLRIRGELMDWTLQAFIPTEAPIGDSTLDGVFDSADLVAVFAAGQYEDRFSFNSAWGQGDWNLDQDFDSGDLVAAFTAGHYEQGASPIPEPSSIVIWLGLVPFALTVRRW